MSNASVACCVALGAWCLQRCNGRADWMADRGADGVRGAGCDCGARGSPGIRAGIAQRRCRVWSRRASGGGGDDYGVPIHCDRNAVLAAGDSVYRRDAECAVAKSISVRRARQLPFLRSRRTLLNSNYRATNKWDANFSGCDSSRRSFVHRSGQ